MCMLMIGIYSYLFFDQQKRKMIQDSVPIEDKAQKSIQDFSHSHPYEYLTKLNGIFNSYNRSTVKDYSLASKIKLPFKKFNTIKVPQCFQSSYAKERKELVHYNSVEDSKTDDNEKKLWKEHRDIIKKYLEEKELKKRKAHRPRNKEFAEKVLSRDRNNMFLKKIIEKGTKFTYDQKKFEQQILNKLKNLNSPKSKEIMRCQTAKVPSELNKSGKPEQRMSEGQKQKVSQKDYLEFEREQDLIMKYKGMIKQVDCSISDKNIQKTTLLLRQMQKIVDDSKY